MTLDELMEVWRAQDDSPLVDRALLHRALQQENAKVQRRRRRARRAMYLVSALVLALLGFCVAVITSSQGDGVRSVWDYLAPSIGAAAALVLVGAIHRTHRSQVARDKGFGESLRDQLARHIAQLEDEATRGVRLGMVIVVSSTVCGMAVSFSGRRINGFPFSEDWLRNGLIVAGLGALLIGWLHRSGQRAFLAQRRRLEALLEELDSGRSL